VKSELHDRNWPIGELSAAEMNARFTSAICSGAELGLYGWMISSHDPEQSQAKPLWVELAIDWDQ